MKKGNTFFWKAVLIVAGLLAIDQGLGALLAHYYFRIAHGDQAKLTYIADSVNTPILIIGSSRAELGYIPDIITDSLHLNCYNAGKDKQGIFYDLAVTKMILQRYHPALIVLDLSPVAFTTAESGLDDLAVLLPYYWPHPEIRHIIDNRSRWEWLKVHSRLYCYNSLLLQIAKATIAKHEDDSVANGYIPKFRSVLGIADPGFSPQELSAPLDSSNIVAFRELLSLTKQNNCPLVVAVSPTFYPISDIPTIGLAGEICRSQRVPFFDYTHFPAFTRRPHLFYDAKHLNDAGARQFTRLLCTDLITKGFQYE